MSTEPPKPINDDNGNTRSHSSGSEDEVVDKKDTIQEGQDDPDGIFSKLKCLGGKSKKKQKEEYYGQPPSSIDMPPTLAGASLEMSPTSTTQDSTDHNTSNTGNIESAPVYRETVTASLRDPCPETIESCDNNDIPRYNFNKPHRGLAIVVAEEDYLIPASSREGAKLDGLRMERIFKKWGFLVKSYPNLKKDELMTILKWASVNKGFDHSFCDSFAFAIFSHGGPRKKKDPKRPNVTRIEDYVETTDHDTILIKDIVDLFKDSNCPSLKGKPRLFFIQACRGKKSNKGVDVYVRKEKVPEQKSATEPSIKLTFQDIHTADHDGDLKKMGFDIEKWIGLSGQQESPDTPDSDALSMGDVNNQQSTPMTWNLAPRQQKVFSDYEEPFNVRPVPGYKDFLILYAAPPASFGIRYFNDRDGGSFPLEGLSIPNGPGDFCPRTACTSIDGVFAFKKGTRGTPFAIHLYNQLYLEFDVNVSLSKMITRACAEMAIEFKTVNSTRSDYDGIKQVMCLTSQLTKEVYFKPKEIVSTV